MFGKRLNTSNSILFQLNQKELQQLQIQSKKIAMQLSTFSLLCGVRLIISSKKFVKFN